ncbi:MAG TPA: winged helix-turn-helix domain-containing protein [Polyangiaceae bacterium]|nr:winged helix-turn-helix domain-containing protein [Polyangiaceae bacterium]
MRGALAHVTATQQHDSSVRQYLRYGPILYDKLRREVRAGNTRVDLRPAELEILAYLLSNAHRQVTARELMQEVLHTAGDGAAARNQVYELRRKLRQAGVAEVIRTEGRQGYRLCWKTPY